ncbi:DNA invertase Pin-like site-specific DNA recombinase [Pseudorhodoplanes sinuspersici]|uniref:Resolvase n=1 Tax=Pseudorhodoplanes sinuspersici TaxID=1235591 RepID=A0A1W6ZZA9_9HYPH|nr:recombinase family protein [Pseudorhodoplanes sinuspersici]ARQ02719.1 resolvase [Pseudorhodoplanes sinuspersici]RKE68137.1 DNA invertase Pin-like site-specific DNA recombinase [Pseudorhodoplanes sinuspersici]
MKVALYARYSSDNQRDASIEDQLRLCRLYAEKQGWTIADSYSDRAISGASLLRPGIQELIHDATRGRFTVVLAEAMDRLSRDQEDIAGLFKRMAFAGVKIVTLSEGDVTHLHVGLKGTMNALFLKDLADKTRRGLRGRVENGKSGGGLCFGYDVVRQFAASGEPIRGDRTINPAEANVVRRIFADYLAGKSSRTIARELNKEGVVGPQGNEWGPSTIHGNPKRGVGILNNELYVGRLVWNRLRYLKDPDTGKRVSRHNPESEWIIQDVPELRIIEQSVWDAVKAQQQKLAYEPSAPGQNALNERRRSKHLFAGLMKCGCCGGGYVLISKDLLGCATARNKGTCDNRMNIRRDVLEASVLNGLHTHLMEPSLFREFCEEFTREVNRLRIERSSSIVGQRKELTKVQRDLERAIQAVLDGVPGAQLKDTIGALESRKAELTEVLAHAEEPPVLLHPNMAEIYRQKISALHHRLQDEDGKAEAAAIFRTLVDQVTLQPEESELAIVLRGDLAAILTFAAGKKKPDLLKEARLLTSVITPGSVVAGTGFEPVTFRL